MVRWMLEGNRHNDNEYAAEHAALNSALTLLNSLSPSELSTIQVTYAALKNHFPLTRFQHHQEYGTLKRTLGLELQEPTPKETHVDPAIEIDVVPPAEETHALLVRPSFESCLESGRQHLAKGWPGMARERIEEALRLQPQSVVAQAYLAWLDFQKTPGSTELRSNLDLALDRALGIHNENDELLTFRGMLLKLDGKLKEAELQLLRAISANPRNANAQCQLWILRQRQSNTGEWPAVDFRSIKLDAAMMIQCRYPGKTTVHSFESNEIRIGSSGQDHLCVRDAVLKHLVKRHCLVLYRAGRHYIRRVASLGKVWVNGREIEIRKDEPVSPDDCIRLGQDLQGPALEFRVFDMKAMSTPASSVRIRVET